MREEIGRRRVELLIENLTFVADEQRRAAAYSAMSRQDWSDAVAAGLTSFLLPALAQHLRQPNVPSDISRYFEQHYGPLLRNYNYRAASQRRMLLPVILALNAAGVTPLLACGACEIWLEAPAWRCVDEMAVLVPTAVFDDANKVIDSLGWQDTRALDPTRYRDERCWVHPESPGHIVLRAGGSHPAIERLLPHAEIERRSHPATIDGGVARLMSPPTRCLHALLNHHFSRGGRLGNTVRIKSLYEFAATVSELTPDHARELDRLAASRAALQDIFDIWIRAASHTFGLPSVPGVDPRGTAERSASLVEASGHYAIALADPPPPGGMAFIPRLRSWLDPKAWMRT